MGGRCGGYVTKIYTINLGYFASLPINEQRYCLKVLYLRLLDIKVDLEIS